MASASKSGSVVKHCRGCSNCGYGVNVEDEVETKKAKSIATKEQGEDGEESEAYEDEEEESQLQTGNKIPPPATSLKRQLAEPRSLGSKKFINPPPPRPIINRLPLFSFILQDNPFQMAIKPKEFLGITQVKLPRR